MEYSGMTKHANLVLFEIFVLFLLRQKIRTSFCAHSTWYTSQELTRIKIELNNNNNKNNYIIIQLNPNHIHRIIRLRLFFSSVVFVPYNVQIQYRHMKECVHVVI